ncbi:hypothetical protein QTP88_028609 [Uroleucon formosanum]
MYDHLILIGKYRFNIISSSPAAFTNNLSPQTARWVGNVTSPLPPVAHSLQSGVRSVYIYELSRTRPRNKKCL